MLPRALLAIAIVEVLAGCKPSKPGNTALTAKSNGEREAPMVDKGDKSAEDVSRLVTDLRSPTEAVRKAAKEKLNKHRSKGMRLSPSQGIQLLKEAAEPFPKDTQWEDVSGDLLALVRDNPDPKFIPIVLEKFDRYSEHGKGNVQSLLLKLKSDAGDDAYMRLLRQHALDGRIPYLITAPLERAPRNPNIFFPELFKYISAKEIGSSVYRLCLAYCEAGLLAPETLDPHINQVLASYSLLEKDVRRAQRPVGIAWMWEEAYSDKRNDVGLLLDLLGYCSRSNAERTLQSALGFLDPHLKCFAVISCVRLGIPVDDKHFADVAVSAEMRNTLFDTLTRLGKSKFFPDKYRTQAAFAESDMVRWLIYPTELARAPDEIELMKVVPVDTGIKDGIYDYFLFRFRTTGDHWAAKDGWMAGVSGPYARKDSPTTQSLGDTFSTFERWESKKPDQHVGDIQELMDKWRKYHSGLQKKPKT